MNNTEQILLIILSSALAIFLILAIVAVINLIRLIKALKNIALKAESFVDSAENAAQMVRNTVGHLSVLKFVHSIIDMVHSKQKSK